VIWVCLPVALKNESWWKEASCQWPKAWLWTDGILGQFGGFSTSKVLNRFAGPSTNGNLEGSTPSGDGFLTKGDLNTVYTLSNISNLVQIGFTNILGALTASCNMTFWIGPMCFDEPQVSQLIPSTHLGPQPPPFWGGDLMVPEALPSRSCLSHFCSNSFGPLDLICFEVNGVQSTTSLLWAPWGWPLCLSAHRSIDLGIG